MCDALQSGFVQEGGRDPSSLGVSIQWSRPGVDRTGAGAEGAAGSRRLSCPPASAWAEKHVLPGGPARAPQPRPPPARLSCAPWGRGPAILLTSWDGAPWLGSNLSGALDHSGRRRLGSHGHTGRRGPRGHGRGSGSHSEQAAGPPGSSPTPRPLSLGKEGRRRGPRGAVTSEAVCTMAPLRAGHEMDSRFPSQLSQCQPAPKRSPPWAPPWRRGGGGGHRGAMAGITPRPSLGGGAGAPRALSFPVWRLGTLPGGAGQSPPAQKTRGQVETCRGAYGGRGVGRPRPEPEAVLSPPPTILGFWAEVSWLIWVPISGRLSCR